MSSVYCPLPFRHAYVDPGGIAACCMSPRSSDSIADWPANAKLISMQQQLLNNEVPESCQGCHDSEKNYGNSLRLDALRDYNNQVFTDTVIDFVDYRSSNICNFKCRSCNPIFSHGISQEVKNSKTLQKYFHVIETKTASVTERDQEWILNNLSQIRRLMLTGGEPTVIPGIKKIVELVAEKYANQISLMITTNASFEDQFWFDITERIPNLHWTVSIDAVGPAAEIVRHGTDWNVVNRNIHWLAKHANSLDINTVITNLNLFQLRDVLTLGHELQQESIFPNGRHGDIGCRHQFCVTTKPYILAVDNLTEELAAQAVPYLEDCLKLDLDQEQRNTITGVLSSMRNFKFDPVLWARSNEYNNEFDLLRSQDHTKLYQGF